MASTEKITSSSHRPRTTSVPPLLSSVYGSSGASHIHSLIFVPSYQARSAQPLPPLLSLSLSISHIDIGIGGIEEIPPPEIHTTYLHTFTVNYTGMATGNNSTRISTGNDTNTTLSELTVAVGIDLGSYHARVATYDKNLDHPVVCANHDGHRETKVIWGEDDSPVTTIESLKGFFEEKVLGLATSTAHTKDLSIVTSIPSYYTHNNNSNGQNGVKEGWLQTLQEYGAVLTEGVAVCLAYGLDGTPITTMKSPPSTNNGNDDNVMTVLVLDGGASALKATVLERRTTGSGSGGLWMERSYQRLETIHGEALVVPLAKEVAQQFEQRCRFPRGEVWQSKRARMKLLKVCEQSLTSFQRLTNVSIHVDGLYEGMDCNVSISKPKWEHLSSTLANQVKVFCTQYTDKVDTVLICGNLHDWMTPIIKGVFGEDKICPPSFDPSEAIALGCTIQARMNLQHILLDQHSSSSAATTNKDGILTKNPTMAVGGCPITIGIKDGDILIPQGMPLPCHIETELRAGTDVELVQLIPTMKTLAKLQDLETTSILQLQLTTQGRLRICVNGDNSILIG